MRAAMAIIITLALVAPANAYLISANVDIGGSSTGWATYRNSYSSVPNLGSARTYGWLSFPSFPSPVYRTYNRISNLGSIRFYGDLSSSRWSVYPRTSLNPLSGSAALSFRSPGLFSAARLSSQTSPITGTFSMRFRPFVVQ